MTGEVTRKFGSMSESQMSCDVSGEKCRASALQWVEQSSPTELLAYQKIPDPSEMKLLQLHSAYSGYEPRLCGLSCYGTSGLAASTGSLQSNFDFDTYPCLCTSDLFLRIVHLVNWRNALEAQRAAIDFGLP